MSQADPPRLGRLYLVPTPLDFGCAVQSALSESMPLHTITVAARLTHWISENAKSTRAFLKRVNELQALSNPIQALHIQELPHAVHKKGDHKSGQAVEFDAKALLAPAFQGIDIGLVSEAGMPASWVPRRRRRSRFRRHSPWRAPAGCGRRRPRRCPRHRRATPA